MTHLRRAGVALALAVLTLVLAGCGASPSSLVSSPKVSVDTPALRAMKAEAHIPDCPSTTATTAAAGGLPDVSLPCLGGGRAVSIAHLRGPMVLNLWAQYCGPCRNEMPHYEAFSKKYGAKVPVIGVDYSDYQPNLALQLATQAKVTYPLVADLEPSIRPVGNALPQVILLDKSGRIAFQRAMVITSVGQLESLVKQYLGVA